MSIHKRTHARTHTIQYTYEADTHKNYIIQHLPLPSLRSDNVAGYLGLLGSLFNKLDTHSKWQQLGTFNTLHKYFTSLFHLSALQALA